MAFGQVSTPQVQLTGPFQGICHPEAIKLLATHIPCSTSFLKNRTMGKVMERNGEPQAGHGEGTQHNSDLMDPQKCPKAN